MKGYYVYILKCADDRYYNGFTSDLENRIEQHQQGKYENSYTFKRKPLEVTFRLSVR